MIPETLAEAQRFRVDMQSPRNARLHSAPEAPVAFGEGRRIKNTRSLCPECLERIDARVFDRFGQVWMDKTCVEHGRFSALLSTDVEQYYRFDARLAGVGSCCAPGQHCGDQVANHSCNLLIEITQRCNLSCPTCFADSSPQRNDYLPLARVEALLDGLIEKGKGGADLVQLSGGEPTIHPEFFEIVDAVLRRGIDRVYINTNGIKLAGREFAQRLASYGERVAVYLQFDGFKRRTLRLLRGRESLIDAKLATLANCERLGIDTVPVMTVTAGVNDDELGAFVEHAVAHDCVQKVMIQPAMYSGRYENPRLVERIGVADVVKAICAQTSGLFRAEDFGPIPCSDPNCFSMALAVRAPSGLIPISRYFPRYQTWGDEDTREIIGTVTDSFDSPDGLASVARWALSNATLDELGDDEVDALLELVLAGQASRAAGAKGWSGMFAIGIKPFMDAYTYDQDRIDRCCVHIVGRDGEPVSFCEYNAINRPQGRL